MTESSWVYIQSEPGLWTVGFNDPDGKWHPDSDQGSKEDAADRVRYLNGGSEGKKGDFQDELGVVFSHVDDDINFEKDTIIDVPKVYSASGVQAVALSMMQEAEMLPDNMNDEQMERLGLTEESLDSQPTLTFRQGDNIVKIKLTQFMIVSHFVHDCMEKVEVAVGRVRRYSGRS